MPIATCSFCDHLITEIRGKRITVTERDNAHYQNRTLARYHPACWSFLEESSQLLLSIYQAALESAKAKENHE